MSGGLGADPRALTVKQPWAWAICHAGKDVENRSHPFPSTVPLPATVMLHAGQGEADLGDAGHEDWAHRYEAEFPPVRGAIVAVIEITGQHIAAECAEYVDIDGPEQHAHGHRLCSIWAMDSDYSGDVLEPMWHWEVSGVTVLDTPVPVKGRLGLWRPDEETIKRVYGQLRESKEAV